MGWVEGYQWKGISEGGVDELLISAYIEKEKPF